MLSKPLKVDPSTSLDIERGYLFCIPADAYDICSGRIHAIGASMATALD